MMMLSEATTAMGGKLNGADIAFSSVDFDTRRLERNALYFAIHGENKNGHAYIQQAITQQAIAAVADEPFEQDAKTHHIKVDDTTTALGQLARYWRARFDMPVVGITGSNGKTTVTQIVKCIFAESLPGIAPQGSFNNQWGVPLTLLKLREEHQSAVIEMGMNHAGELSYLGKIVKPTIGLITNAAAAHLEGLKTLDGVAMAKGEIIDSLDDDGTMILNRDDKYFEAWKARAGVRKMLSFGRHQDADVRLLESDSSNLRFEFLSDIYEFEFALIGQHNHLNGVAAIAVALAANVPFDAIAAGLKKALAVKGRLQIIELDADFTLIDDTYNANLDSMRAAINVLCKQVGVKILVLGGLAELGDQAQEMHHQVGRYAKQQGVDIVLILNEKDKQELNAHTEAYQLGFGSEAVIMNHVDKIVSRLEHFKSSPATVLVKGSRSAKMERVVEAMKSKGGKQC